MKHFAVLAVGEPRKGVGRCVQGELPEWNGQGMVCEEVCWCSRWCVGGALYRLHVGQLCLEPMMADSHRNGTAMEGVSMAWKGVAGVGTSHGGGGE